MLASPWWGSPLAPDWWWNQTTFVDWQVKVHKVEYSSMIFETKIALVIRSDLETWQKINVAAFLASGIAAEFPECIGEPYEDGSETKYSRLFGQPVLVYGADNVGLARALERALTREVKPAIYTKEMFVTNNDIDNRGVVKAVERTKLDLVGIAFRADRKTVDKIVDKLSFLK